MISNFTSNTAEQCTFYVAQTLLRCRNEYGLSVGSTRGSRSTSTEITQNHLLDATREVLQIFQMQKRPSFLAPSVKETFTSSGGE